MASAEHVLVIGDLDGRRTYAVECPGVTESCRAWEECTADDCDRDVLDQKEYDGDEEPDLHGQRHRQMDGWMVATSECFIAGHHNLADVAADLWPIGEVPVGRFPVVAERDPYDRPEDLRLKLIIEPERSSP